MVLRGLRGPYIGPPLCRQTTASVTSSSLAAREILPSKHSLLQAKKEESDGAKTVHSSDSELPIWFTLTHFFPPFQHLLSERRSLLDSKCWNGGNKWVNLNRYDLDIDDLTKLLRTPFGTREPTLVKTRSELLISQIPTSLINGLIAHCKKFLLTNLYLL